MEEATLRTIDDIITDMHKTHEAALREAFEAGRAHAVSELKSKMTAFFEGLIPSAQPQEEPQSAPQTTEHHIEPQTEQHYD